MAETLRVEAFVLGKALKTKQWEYKLLVLNKGAVLAYTYAKKGQNPAALDIFDHCDCVLESFASDSLYSLKDVDLIRHYGGIGRRYQSLLYASRLVSLLWGNAELLDGSEPFFQLFLKAFEALELSPFPELIYLKVLYKWLKLEGYPVKEQWLSSYVEDPESLKKVLFTEPKGLELDRPRLKQWIGSLQSWMQQHTPLIDL